MAAKSSNPYLQLVSASEDFRREDPQLTGGGGGGTFEPMELRVKALEDKFEKIDGKLTMISNDMAYLKGRSEHVPSSKEFGELKGRVDSLPTTAKAAAMLGIAVAVITIILKWPELSAMMPPTP